MSNSLRPHGLQHTRLPCPSPTPGACSNSCPFSRWCHLTITSFVVLFSSCLQSFPASGSFAMSQFFASSGQSTGASSNEYSGLISFSIDWLDLLAVQETLKSLLQHHSSKPSILQHSAFFIVQFSHPYMTTGKTIALTRWTFVSKVMSLLFIFLYFLLFMILYYYYYYFYFTILYWFCHTCMSLFFNMLSRLIIAFFPPRSKHL